MGVVAESGYSFYYSSTFSNSLLLFVDKDFIGMNHESAAECSHIQILMHKSMYFGIVLFNIPKSGV